MCVSYSVYVTSLSVSLLICLSVFVVQVRQLLLALSPVSCMWTWTVSLSPWGSDTDQTSKVYTHKLKYFYHICYSSPKCPLTAPPPLLPPGKSVAVTSNRGSGRVAQRPGVDRQLELQYYQRKYSHAGVSERKDGDLEDMTSAESHVSHGNGVDPDTTCLSMAEIASCSYEAR